MGWFLIVMKERMAVTIRTYPIKLGMKQKISLVVTVPMEEIKQDREHSVDELASWFEMFGVRYAGTAW